MKKSDSFIDIEQKLSFVNLGIFDMLQVLLYSARYVVPKLDSKLCNYDDFLKLWLAPRSTNEDSKLGRTDIWRNIY